jgi:hypothetical protein
MFGSMEGQTGRAKDITADAARFRVGATQIDSAVGTLLAGISRAGIAARMLNS